MKNLIREDYVGNIVLDLAHKAGISKNYLNASQAGIQKWVRDNYHIHTEIWFDQYVQSKNPNSIIWECSLYLIPSGLKLNESLIIKGGSYEEALEKGLIAALEYIIQFNKEYQI